MLWAFPGGCKMGNCFNILYDYMFLTLPLIDFIIYEYFKKNKIKTFTALCQAKNQKFGRDILNQSDASSGLFNQIPPPPLTKLPGTPLLIE